MAWNTFTGKLTAIFFSCFCLFYLFFLICYVIISLLYDMHCMCRVDNELLLSNCYNFASLVTISIVYFLNLYRYNSHNVFIIYFFSLSHCRRIKCSTIRYWISSFFCITHLILSDSDYCQSRHFRHILHLLCSLKFDPHIVNFDRSVPKLSQNGLHIICDWNK